MLKALKFNISNLTAIYRSPITCIKMFNRNLLTYLENNIPKYHIITDDINIKHLKKMKTMKSIKIY